MRQRIRNLVFEGGGILGISYLGALDYLYYQGHMKELERVAGTSAGAITACIASFDLPFEAIREIAATLDYRKVPSKTEIDNLMLIPEEGKKIFDDLFGDINCIYRLIHNYGWYSTDYFYSWMKDVIADQFDSKKKLPPYTFSDFQNPDFHKNNRPFLDLYVVGTDLTMKMSKVFSYETTPDMEVAEAVRISMSIPLYFEAVKLKSLTREGDSVTNVLCDGGIMNNYPLNLFDNPKYNPVLLQGTNMETLGVCFHNKIKDKEIDSLLSYIESLLHVASYLQQEIYESNELNRDRSIIINTYEISPLDFNITTGDTKYRFLYMQGYRAAKDFFKT